MLSLMFLVYSTKHSAHSENGDQRMRQVVAYKQWKIINRQAQKVVAVAYRRWSFTRGSNCKALTGKILVIWIGGRFQWSQKGSSFCDTRRLNFKAFA